MHESTPEKSSADAQHGSIQKSTPDQMIVKPVEDHDGTYFDQAGSELKTILERRRRRSEVGATAAYVTPSSPEAKAESPPLAAKPEPTPAAAKEQKGQQNEENHHMGADPHKECEKFARCGSSCESPGKRSRSRSRARSLLEERHTCKLGRCSRKKHAPARRSH